MTTLPPALSEAEQKDILALGARIEAHIAEQWQPLLEENDEVLRVAYERSGDAAYGVYLGLIFRPIRILMEQAGLRANPHFPGDFDASREWGNEDESDNQRWMWTTIENADGQTLGTLVTIAHHSHQGFHIPRAPGLLALREVGKAAVEAELSHRSADFAAATEFSVWYAEYLKSQGEEA
jgi:hypothetical protein